MRKDAWASPVSPDEAARRAAGRRRYNSVRQLNAQLRRAEIYELLGRYGWMHGTQARIARMLGVSEATISRDFKLLFRYLTCPTCRCSYPLQHWRDLERRGFVKLCSAPHPQQAAGGA